MANPAETPAPASALQSFHRVVFLVFLLSFGTTFALMASGSAPATFRPPLTLLLVSAFATTLLSFVLSLPPQNVLSIVALIGLVSSLVEIINLKTSLPFGHRIWTDNLGPQIFHLLPWPVPFIWVVVILNSRGVARFLLRPWRNLRNYGLLSLALTALLAGIFDFGLEHFAAANQLWHWRDSKIAPWSAFPAYALVSAVILLIITPWLINKKPAPPPPPDYHPVIVWFLLLALLAI